MNKMYDFMMLNKEEIITEWGNNMFSNTDAYYECEDQNMEIVIEL